MVSTGTAKRVHGLCERGRPTGLIVETPKGQRVFGGVGWGVGGGGTVPAALNMQKRGGIGEKQQLRV